MSSYNGLIDLHVHLDGSLSPDTVRYLADMQNISLIEGKDNKDISTLELDKKLKINEKIKTTAAIAIPYPYDALL